MLTLIPQILFIEAHTDLFEKIEVFLLKRSHPVMLFLVADILDERGKLRIPHGKCTIATLPGERFVLFTLPANPFGRISFQMPEKIALVVGSGLAHSEVDMVSHTSDPVTLPISIACTGGKIGVHRFFDLIIQIRHSVLGRENKMDDGLGNRLWHDAY